ncbi:hypothetical protein [Chryseobacterium sp.]|uniref:hypothetical protein n=1 Tax=Chryseobacterium sp. TaxID=1871047 RepID=UPI00388FC96F
MLKKLAFILLFYLSLHPIFSQAFDYERTWGTYYGPAGNIFDVHTANGGFIVDPQNNLHLLGQIDMNNGVSASYYNQYLTHPVGKV